MCITQEGYLTMSNNAEVREHASEDVTDFLSKKYHDYLHSQTFQKLISKNKRKGEDTELTGSQKTSTRGISRMIRKSNCGLKKG